MAAVDRGPRQAAAIGFVLWAGVYAYLMTTGAGIAYVRQSELDPYEGSLPTTQILRPLFEAIVQRRWIDSVTGQEIPNYDPNQPIPPSNSGGLGGGGFAGGMGMGGGMGWPASPTMAETPAREDFMAIGHLLWLLLFGYVGARLARGIYPHRVSRHNE
jgi:hypothetical protein